MKLNNPDFIIKEENRLDEGTEYILRRYKGKGGVVEIPEGVTQIENNIFGDDIEPNKTVTKIIMPDSVTDIEMDAFSYCEKLTEIIFSKNLKNLSLDLRGCTSLKEVSIPDSVTSIGYFHREKNLTEIYIGSNLIEADESAFCFISDDTVEAEEDETTYNEAIQKDRNDTIAVLSQNPSYRIIDGFMVNKNTKTALFRTDFNKNELRIPDIVETIGSHCMSERCLFGTKDVFLEKLIIPWFGESEKLIKKIFTSYKHECEAAEKKGVPMPILLFNEADALIAKRKDSSAGNCAQTENAIQNIILEELENLKGIFIATTNLASNMDSAFERRFLFKIKFENPSTEAKTSIWMNKLSWLDKNSAIDFAQAYDFSGGQIDNIVRKIALDEVISGERPAISEIHEMCRCEKLENTNGLKRVGFSL